VWPRSKRLGVTTAPQARYNHRFGPSAPKVLASDEASFASVTHGGQDVSVFNTRRYRRLCLQCRCGAEGRGNLNPQPSNAHEQAAVGALKQGGSDRESALVGVVGFKPHAAEA
jgi:hypothetical protein